MRRAMMRKDCWTKEKFLLVSKSMMTIVSPTIKRRRAILRGRVIVGLGIFWCLVLAAVRGSDPSSKPRKFSSEC